MTRKDYASADAIAATMSPRSLIIETLIVGLGVMLVVFLLNRVWTAWKEGPGLPPHPPFLIPINRHRPIRLRLAHLYLDRQISQELHKLRVGKDAPPPELAMVRAMAMTHLDDFGYNPPVSKKPFAEGMRRALADVWNGASPTSIFEVLTSPPVPPLPPTLPTPKISFGGVARYMMLERAVEDVATRLRIADYLATHPEARDIVLPRIILVTGLPDSGTAEIRDVMGLHPSIKVPADWELACPVLPKIKGDLGGGVGKHGKKRDVGGKRVDARQRRVGQFWEWAGKYVKEMRGGGVLDVDGFRYMATGYFDAIFPELHTYGTFPLRTLREHSMKTENISQSLNLLKDLLKVLLHQDATHNTSATPTSDTPPSSPTSPFSKTTFPPSAIILEGSHHLPCLTTFADVFGADRVTVVWVHRDPTSCAISAMRRTEVARSCLLKPVLVDGASIRSSSHLDNREGSRATLDALNDVLKKATAQRNILEKKGVGFLDITASEVFVDVRGRLLKDVLGGAGVFGRVDEVVVGAMESAAAAAAVGWRVAMGRERGISEEEVEKESRNGGRSLEGWMRGRGKKVGEVLLRFGVEEEDVCRRKGFVEYVERFRVAMEWEREGKKNN